MASKKERIDRMIPILKSSKTALVYLLIFTVIPISIVFHDESSVFSADLSDVSALSCSGGIISIGDQKYDVIVKCGEPTTKMADGSSWVYDLGSLELVRYITFVGDKVHRIQLGGYGRR
jgi:hypothetical protein